MQLWIGPPYVWIRPWGSIVLVYVSYPCVLIPRNPAFNLNKFFCFIPLISIEHFLSLNSEILKKICSVDQKKRSTLIYFSTNYRTEMKLVSIIIDYCLRQILALKFFLGAHVHGRSLPNFNFFNINHFNEIVKFNSEIGWKQIFTPFLILFWELLDVGIIAIASL